MEAGGLRGGRGNGGDREGGFCCDFKRLGAVPPLGLLDVVFSLPSPTGLTCAAPSAPEVNEGKAGSSSLRSSQCLEESTDSSSLIACPPYAEKR